MNRLVKFIKEFCFSKRGVSKTAEIILWATVTVIAVTTISIGIYTHIGTAASTVTTKIDGAIQ